VVVLETVSRTKISCVPFVSPATRLVAKEVKATRLPSALIAGDLARRLGLTSDAMVLTPTRSTPPLKGMGQKQRLRTVAGAFAVTDKARIAGKRIVLVDDVLTTGSTAEACARTLQRAGAARVELVCWAGVVRPAQLFR